MSLVIKYLVGRRGQPSEGVKKKPRRRMRAMAGDGD